MIQEKSSFRDPASRVYHEGAAIYREIYPSYFADYDHLIKSGLYGELVQSGLMIRHTEVSRTNDCLLVRAVKVPFISYPYEWCFSMLKEAALTTLKINRIAMEHGMMLKDASAYNIQYHDGKMKLIDTCSFIQYKDGTPWGAYPQFLRHFLSPLLLMAYGQAELGKLSEVWIDGPPIKLTARLLPARAKLHPSLWAHVFAQTLTEIGVRLENPVTMPKLNLVALLSNLEGLVKHLNYKPRSGWTKYGECDSYNEQALRDKRRIVENVLEKKLGTLCDLGANTGDYSRLACQFGNEVISVDSDHDCVEMLYRQGGIFGLVVDLTNPSPAIGWDNTERVSFLDRLHVDTILALALIHHLCIANNVPLGRVAEMLAGHCQHLIIEFVPLKDPKAQLLLGFKNIPPYSLEIFDAEFRRYFDIKSETKIADSLRTIYVMERK